MWPPGKGRRAVSAPAALPCHRPRPLARQIKPAAVRKRYGAFQCARGRRRRLPPCGSGCGRLPELVLRQRAHLVRAQREVRQGQEGRTGGRDLSNRRGGRQRGEAHGRLQWRCRARRPAVAGEGATYRGTPLPSAGDDGRRRRVGSPRRVRRFGRITAEATGRIGGPHQSRARFAVGFSEA